ncbi:MAG: alkaline phosphatase D family protein [Ilumatobacteraceae bacterium]
MRPGPFRHGVASGEPALTSVALWTRVTTSEAHLPLRWVIAPDVPGDDADSSAAASPPSIEGVRTGTVVASYTDDHTVTVAVDGLSPGVRYRYHFEAPDGSVSQQGSTRTVPAEADGYRIGFTCCSHYGLGWFTAYRMLAAENCDLVVHLGDYIYEDATVWIPERQPDPGYEAQTLGDYRRRHAHHRLDPDLQALHHAAPMVALWDDHDVNGQSPEGDDLAARQRRADGQQAWREWLPLVTGRGQPIDRLVTVPGLVDVVTIDARYTGREPHHRAGPRPEPRQNLRILSDDQWSWLERTMAASSAPWRVLANQVQVGPMRLGSVPSVVRRSMRPIVNPDQWDGYPAERRRLFEILGGSGPTLLTSGDLHSTWSRRLSDDDGQPVAHEVTVPSVSGESYAFAFRRHTRLPVRLLDRMIRSLNDGIDVLDLHRHGYVVVDVEREQLDVTAVLLDTVLEPTTGAERLRLASLTP